MSSYLVVMTTVGSAEVAQQIASSIVELQLAACAQVIGPIQSTFWWEGKVESSGEWLILFKTRAELYDELELAVKARHPYKVPELVATPVVAGNASYLTWITQMTKSPT